MDSGGEGGTARRGGARTAAAGACHFCDIVRHLAGNRARIRPVLPLLLPLLNLPWGPRGGGEQETMDGRSREAHPVHWAHAHGPLLELLALRLLVAVVVLALVPRVIVPVMVFGRCQPVFLSAL